MSTTVKVLLAIAGLLIAYMGGCVSGCTTGYTLEEAKKEIENAKIAALELERNAAKKDAEDAKKAKDDAENAKKVADGMKAEWETLRAQRDAVVQLRHDAEVAKARNAGKVAVADKEKNLDIRAAVDAAIVGERTQLQSKLDNLDQKKEEFVDAKLQAAEEERRRAERLNAEVVRAAAGVQQRQQPFVGQGWVGPGGGGNHRLDYYGGDHLRGRRR